MSGFGNNGNDKKNGQTPQNWKNRDTPNNNNGRQDDRRGGNWRNYGNQPRNTGRSNGGYGEENRDRSYQEFQQQSRRHSIGHRSVRRSPSPIQDEQDGYDPVTGTFCHPRYTAHVDSDYEYEEDDTDEEDEEVEENTVCGQAVKDEDAQNDEKAQNNQERICSEENKHFTNTGGWNKKNCEERDSREQRLSSNYGNHSERDRYRMEEFRRTGKLGRYEEAREVSHYRSLRHPDKVHQQKWNDPSNKNQWNRSNGQNWNGGNREDWKNCGNTNQGWSSNEKDYVNHQEDCNESWSQQMEREGYNGANRDNEPSTSEDRRGATWDDENQENHQHENWQGTDGHQSEYDREETDGGNSDDEPSTSDGRRGTSSNQNRRADQEEEVTPEIKASIMAMLPQTMGCFPKLPKE